MLVTIKYNTAIDWCSERLLFIVLTCQHICSITHIHAWHSCFTIHTHQPQSQSAVTLRQKSTHQNQSPIKVVSCVRFHHHSPSNQQPIRAQIHDMAASRLTMIPQQPSSQLSINSPSHAKQPDHRHTHTHTQTILQITDTRGRCTFAYTVAGTVGCPKTHHHTLATRSQTHVADAQSPTQLLAQSAVWKLTIIH